MNNRRVLVDSIGASAIGIANYRVLDEHRGYLDEWLAEGCEAELGYMCEHRREDSRIILPECQSLVVVLFSPQKWTYHSPIRKRLKRLLALLKERNSAIEGRGVVDTAPLLERAWGVEANLGWIGRNSMLIHPELGSNFNIGVLLLNVSIEQLCASCGEELILQLTVGSYASRVADRCASCVGLCIENCPGGAIRGNRTIDCRLCHSYLSQQVRGSLSVEELGCTVCQRVCPFF